MKVNKVLKSYLEKDQKELIFLLLLKEKLVFVYMMI